MALQDPMFHRLQQVLLVSESSKPENMFCTATFGFELTGLSRSNGVDPSPSDDEASPADVSKSDPAQRSRNQASSPTALVRDTVLRPLATRFPSGLRASTEPGRSPRGFSAGWPQGKSGRATTPRPISTKPISWRRSAGFMSLSPTLDRLTSYIWMNSAHSSATRMLPPCAATIAFTLSTGSEHTSPSSFFTGGHTPVVTVVYRGGQSGITAHRICRSCAGVYTATALCRHSLALCDPPH
mmetsp:Transcript_5830/g.12674  ORF Transcript_5830/g.12674 Transcript_5830/m.12674 type:complete len:240 (-) Transcript_5830:224-943(-)